MGPLVLSLVYNIIICYTSHRLPLFNFILFKYIEAQLTVQACNYYSEAQLTVQLHLLPFWYSEA